MSNDLTFNNLISQIRQIDERLAVHAGKAVNISLTLRNWFIGLYIAMFELNGADRATYGEALLAELSKALRKHAVSNSGRRQLYNYLQFYRTYPQIVRTVSAQFIHMLPEELKRKAKVRTASAQLTIPPEKLLGCLSYSHFELLVSVEDYTKRTFLSLFLPIKSCSTQSLKPNGIPF